MTRLVLVLAAAAGLALAAPVAAGTDDAWLSRHLIADWGQAATLLVVHYGLGFPVMLPPLIHI